MMMTMETAVQEVMRMHKSLPARPGIEEVEAARILIQNVEREDELKVERIGEAKRGEDVAEELCRILQEMRRNVIDLQKKEAEKVLDVEGVHSLFDDLIQRASECLKSYAANTSSLAVLNSNSGTTRKTGEPSGDEEPLKAKDDLYLKKPKKSGCRKVLGDFTHGGFSIGYVVAGDEKLNLIRLGSWIELWVKKGSREVILQGKLCDQLEWLPDSIGKLSSVMKLDLSENRIVMLPGAIGGLSSIQTLDLHGNKIKQLPESIGDLLHLLHLDLRGNQLTVLPATLDRLVHLQELDLSSNGIAVLPETIGSLVSLQKLSIETNDIEELPHAIGRCSCLKELRADYNRLKALPEAVGRIQSLEILTLRYNNIRQLPTTMASLSSLRQLDVSFNELEAIPESLCFATTLVKMDVSNNFADLQALPRSIGNLEMLEELMSHNNQIRVLPESFGMLRRLRLLNLEGNPLVVPPRDVVDKGAEAVVRYMAAKREVKPQMKKHNKCCTFFAISNKTKRKPNVGEYAKS